MLAIVLLFVLGCAQYSIRNIDKPAPQTNEGWLRADGTRVSTFEAGKALLECGAPSPELNAFVYQQALGINDPDQRLNHYFAVMRCMEHSGFALQSNDSVPKYCSWDHNKHLSACRSGATFPERSVERRLNSWYCKLETDLEYCRKHAFTPSACDDPKIDYDNPPPICRP